MTNDIKKFCEKFDACEEGAKWAIENCKDMADVWQKAKPEWLIWVATRKGVLTDKQLRLFTVWCCRQIWHLMTDERSRNAVDVAEKYANGKATKEELATAMFAARAAAWAAAMDAAWDAAWAAARDAAWDAAWDAARAAAWDAARDADRDAAWDAAWAAQSQYLRDTYSPFAKPKKRRKK